MIPGLEHLFTCNPLNQVGCPPGQGVPRLPGAQDFATLGDVVSGMLNIAFSIAVFLAFFWLVWGAFQYMAAGGSKERLAQARARITWAIVGLLLVAVSFLVAQFLAQVLPPQKGTPILSVPTAYAVVNIDNEYGFGNIGSLGEGTSKLVAPAFSIATAVVVIYFLIGAFKFLTSGGDKETTSSARGMITHAIIGFIILMFAFLILQFIPEIFKLRFSLF